MELNGNGIHQVKIDLAARIVQLGPDQFEVRIHAIGQYPQGTRVIGEATFRSFEQGVEPLRQLANAHKAVTALAAQVSSGLVMPLK